MRPAIQRRRHFRIDRTSQVSPQRLRLTPGIPPVDFKAPCCTALHNTLTWLFNTEVTMTDMVLSFKHLILGLFLYYSTTQNLVDPSEVCHPDSAMIHAA